MTIFDLADLPQKSRDTSLGITSICSAHPVVLRAALTEAAGREGPLLIEATCNQVNQEGGYTGMTPAAFRDFVLDLAAKAAFDTSRMILGGDHLGPNPWKHLPAEEAMGRAEAMVAAFVEAGFTKIHLDTSMGCAGEPVAVPDEITAGRAARLAKVAEATAERQGSRLHYIVGTEVPPPGGATHSLSSLKPTSPEAALETVEVHRKAFAAAGLEAAFERAIGLVVQPGVEFGGEEVHAYDPAAARALSSALGQLPGFVFEAHSTDYQPVSALSALVDDGFAILKVGPGLTFAMREALYGLDAISAILDKVPADETLRATMERVMVDDPRYWKGHYHCEEAELLRQRHYSYSDRIRYYWPRPEVQHAVDALLARLGNRPIPETLISQHLAWLYPDVAARRFPARPAELIEQSVCRVIRSYSQATLG
ncbi:D-tagatose-bisphosphate aldolase, class II, non-catalytic subunit [Consotaella salsifontis]|uniref:Tagatose-bisphosphate aldolase noncatalytic subunit n=1 Tax=Consotaella salsifontis TaxID=1365950 RepID=A0A1T4RPE8_9HYPH|nr:D-tagatose-bisphosphate aldolase, class II, non-catalytic subunit [Consotaella salsifontis]SKA17628.1 tagatose-bisphosphate aldolase noncatalytic subunit [Consotaella salsifontis]